MERKTMEDVNSQIIHQMADLIAKLGYDSGVEDIRYSSNESLDADEALRQLKNINASFSKSDAIPVIRILLDRYSITKDEI